MNGWNLYKKLFLSMFYLSAFTFGGGYVIISLMQKQFVEKYHWISEEEMLDLVAIAQSAPGPIAVNGSIAIGYKLGGPFGIVVCVLATILPPFLIMVILWYAANAIGELPLWATHFMKGMEIGVCALILSVVIDMVKKFGKQIFPYIVMILTVLACGILSLPIPLVLMVWILCGLFERKKICS